MIKIEEVLSNMKEKWSIPSYPKNKAEEADFKLVCYLNENHEPFINDLNIKIPQDLIILWSLINNAELFKDVEFGQWGLEILSKDDAVKVTHESLKERPNDFTSDDLVVGRFIGDSDLLVVCCNEGEHFGNVLVALPIDDRRNWWVVAPSLSDFLAKYLEYEGDKYWER